MNGMKAAIEKEIEEALARITQRMGADALFLAGGEWEGGLKFHFRLLKETPWGDGEIGGFVLAPKGPAPDGTYPLVLYLGLPGEPPEVLPNWIRAEKRPEVLEGGYLVSVVQLPRSLEEIGEGLERLFRHLLGVMVAVLQKEKAFLPPLRA